MATRNCQWCGKSFETCGDSVALGSWRADLCSSSCFQAKCITLDFKAGNLTANEAVEQFVQIGVDPHDASPIIGLDKCVAPLINNAVVVELAADLDKPVRRKSVLRDTSE